MKRWKYQCKMNRRKSGILELSKFILKDLCYRKIATLLQKYLGHYRGEVGPINSIWGVKDIQAG